MLFIQLEVNLTFVDRVNSYYSGFYGVEVCCGNKHPKVRGDRKLFPSTHTFTPGCVHSFEVGSR